VILASEAVATEEGTAVARFEFLIQTEQGALVVTCGWDEHLGFFCVVRCGRVMLLDYDCTVTGYDGVPGLLHGLVTAGVVGEDDVEEAVRRLPALESLDDIEDQSVRLVAAVITNLRAAAGDGQ